MTGVRYGCAALAAIAMVGLGAARADSTGDRLDRVERELNQLQRQVYRSEVGTAPPVVGAAPEGGSGPQALDVQIRMDQIEAQMRTLTGQFEELQYSLSQLSSKLDKVQADNEVRFQQLESAPVDTAAAGKSARKPVAAPTSAVAPAGRNPGAGDMSQAPTTNGLLVVPGDHAPPDAAPAAPAANLLPSGTVQEEYNNAFGVLRRGGDYAAAEAAFKAFLVKHPKDPLAANAQYWLGETYFVRKDYPAAASAFAEGYQKYPQSPKAADTLLKLGMSLGDEGRKQDACFAFARLERDFPTMEPALKERMASEKKRYAC